jgi:hypothetical protein
MKKTLTLLERCQSEARETNERHHRACYRYILPEESLERAITYWNERTDHLIANTLKQAAESLEGMKVDIPTRELHNRSLGISNQARRKSRWRALKYNQALTDAQRLLGGELDI